MKLYVEDDPEGIPYIAWEDDIVFHILNNILSMYAFWWATDDSDRERGYFCSHLLCEREVLNHLEVCGVKIITIPTSSNYHSEDFLVKVKQMKNNENIH